MLRWSQATNVRAAHTDMSIYGLWSAYLQLYTARVEDYCLSPSGSLTCCLEEWSFFSCHYVD